LTAVNQSKLTVCWSQVIVRIQIKDRLQRWERKARAAVFLILNCSLVVA